MIEMRMDGRCALITGGSQGIGFAAAMNFMRAGASVAIVPRRPDVLEQARLALAREEREGLSASLATSARRTTAPASSPPPRRSLAGSMCCSTTPARIPMGRSRLRPMNLAAGFRPEAVLGHPSRSSRVPGMKARKWGRIVNVLDSGAKWQRHGSAPTSVTRAAGMALTKVLSNEGAPTMCWSMRCSSASSRPISGSASRSGRPRSARQMASRAARPHRHRGGVRQYGPVPGVGCRQLRHGHRHQCRRRGCARWCRPSRSVLNGSLKPHRQRRPLRYASANTKPMAGRKPAMTSDGRKPS